ncbi:hypothetical protein KKF25_02420 [Patescibacteria group bacterium]|nr:hypothetical protein [Patescibacteria group bacterium]
MGNIVPVGTERKDVWAYLDTISKEETHLYVAIAVISRDDEVARAAAERVKNNEMYNLRIAGYDKIGETEEFKKEIENAAYTVHKYVFKWSEWKKGVMKTAKA